MEMLNGWNGEELAPLRARKADELDEEISYLFRNPMEIKRLESGENEEKSMTVKQLKTVLVFNWFDHLYQPS